MRKQVLKISGIFLVFIFTFINSIYALSPQSELKYEGIDVSDWQGYIDYIQVKNSGIEVVYIKASQGNNIKDPYFDINYENSKANNLKVGFYHFLTATTVEEAEQQATFFASVISGKQADCKLAMDYEQFDGIDTQLINQIAMAFMQKVEELTKKQVIIYSDLYNSENTFNSELASQGELWIAYYGDYKNLENVNSSWNTFIGVQYADQGNVAGINGNVDLECLEALDVALFNENMLDLINGQEVTLPHFDFQKGYRVPGRTIKLEPDEIIIIEGIHALNEKLTSLIAKHQKFKIFIAPQAQINLDNHNPISLTDLRLLRRIVRDFQFRNASAEETMEMWPSVRKGEFKWIYKTQENADYVFNSLLPYELCVMKTFALPLLKKIDYNSPHYILANRLVKFLKYFVDLDTKWIPCNSILREFVGGSCFDV